MINEIEKIMIEDTEYPYDSEREYIKDDEGNKVYTNCSAYGEKSEIPKNFKQGDFVKIFGQVRTSIDDNGKEHSNVRILSSKLLKAKEQNKTVDKGQENSKNSVLSAIKKYQAEDKEKPKSKQETSKETER